MKVNKFILIFLFSFILIGSVIAYDLLPIYNPFGKHLQYITTGNYSGDNLIANNLTVENSAVINNNLTVSGNISIGGYYSGQPIDGGIGSGIIYAESLTSSANLNVTHSGLVVSYPAFQVRLVKSDLSTKYCSFPAGTETVTDEQHSVYYVDNNCVIQSTTMELYKNTLLSPGGQADIFNTVAHSGDIEVISGSVLLQKSNIKQRQLELQANNLKVISGFNINEGPVWLNFSIDSGKYQYTRDIAVTTLQNLSKGAELEVIYKTGVNTWGYSEQHQLNISSCDTGSGIADCSGSNYRRHFIFVVGFNNSVDKTELHQLLPLQSVTYSNLANCENTVLYPLTYTLPAVYQNSAVMLYAICARRGDTNWGSTGLIDLRTVKTSTATGGVDTSVFVAKAGDTMTGNLTVTDCIKGASGGELCFKAI